MMRMRARDLATFCFQAWAPANWPSACDDTVTLNQNNPKTFKTMYTVHVAVLSSVFEGIISSLRVRGFCSLCFFSLSARWEWDHLFPDTTASFVFPFGLFPPHCNCNCMPMVY